MMNWTALAFLLLLLVIGLSEPKKSDVKVKKAKNLAPTEDVSARIRRCPNSYMCINRRCRIRSHISHVSLSRGSRGYVNRNTLSFVCGIRNGNKKG